MPDIGQLVLLRHGHSEWNLSNRFTGWTDVLLTDIGLEEAENAGRVLHQHGLQFHEAHISVLQRTKQTLDSLLIGARHTTIPTFAHWRLNERHYGQLQGMRKDEIFDRWGERESFGWWRGYSERPPALAPDDTRHPSKDPLYQQIPAQYIPNGESLKDCLQRLLPYWQTMLLPSLAQGKNLIVVSHGNCLRAMIMHLEHLNATEIQRVEIPSATPLLYQFNNELKVTARRWLSA